MFSFLLLFWPQSSCVFMLKERTGAEYSSVNVRGAKMLIPEYESESGGGGIDRCGTVYSRSEASLVPLGWGSRRY